MEAKFEKYTLIFEKPSGTSRGVLTTKDTYLLHLREVEKGNNRGVGECGVFRGLSFDDVPHYEEKLKWLCENINLDKETLKEELRDFPSIWIGYEQAVANLLYGEALYFPSDFTDGKDSVTINGLIWMSDREEMIRQIEKKIAQKYSCIKLKIGVDLESELDILRMLRLSFPKKVLEIRVDANGAFSYDKAQMVLEQLALRDVHSIEQPIKARNISQMADLCRNSPIPIALDEELIGVVEPESKRQLLQDIKPQYIILKPSLVGGFSGSDEWIEVAESLGIGWWITSALESNIGLNAIAQYTYTKNNPIPQGLGTGMLFVNNFQSSLILKKDKLYFEKSSKVCF
ncbi:o-succinylbenzoate synthase [Riemerella columbipharyngis]|uniref:o-succinylbenzoate synthase n=1 Tax=Riemerella columbipharyngis TaxID=1071918 RepID=UPI0015A0FCB8|nr:o-succinylbenzoate synthase [Riemerella columbipharyngis]